MTTLATTEAFAEYRHVDHDPADVGAIRALESASALIRASLGMVLDFVEDDVEILDGKGLEGVLLPQLPVVEVTDVTMLDSVENSVLATTDYYVDHAGILWRTPALTWPWSRWPAWARGNVQVTYTHGYETMPDEAVTLCLMVASRLHASSVSAGSTVTSKTIGSASATYADTAGATNQRGLTTTENALLRAFPWPIPVVAEAS